MSDSIIFNVEQPYEGEGLFQWGCLTPYIASPKSALTNQDYPT